MIPTHFLALVMKVKILVFNIRQVELIVASQLLHKPPQIKERVYFVDITLISVLHRLFISFLFYKVDQSLSTVKLV